MTSARLYLRCLGWGLVTGAVAGAVTAGVAGFWAGDSLGDGSVGAHLGLALVFALYGVVIGTLVAVVPTVLGGLVVATLLPRLHPHPASLDAVRRDLTLFFVIVVALLNVAALALLVSLDGWSEIWLEMPLVFAGDIAVLLMLRRARTSIAAAWVGSPSLVSD